MSWYCWVGLYLVIGLAIYARSVWEACRAGVEVDSEEAAVKLVAVPLFWPIFVIGNSVALLTYKHRK